MISTLNFRDFEFKTLPAHMFVVVPKNEYGRIILFDSVNLNFVCANTNNESVNNLLTIDEAINSGAISREKYVEVLTNLNLNDIDNTLDSQLKEKNRNGDSAFNFSQYRDYMDRDFRMPIQFHSLFYKKNRKYFNEGDSAYLLRIEDGAWDDYRIMTFERKDGKIVKMQTPFIFYAERHPNIKQALRDYIVDTINSMDNFVGGINKIDVCIYNIAQRINLFLYSNEL